MSAEQFDALRAAVDGDRLLRSELEAAESIEAWVTIAREHGFDISRADLPRPDKGRDLTDTELEGAAGGRIFYAPTAWQAYCQTSQC